MEMRNMNQETAALLQQLQTICATMEPCELRADAVYFEKHDLTIQLSVQEDQPQRARLLFTASCPRFEQPLQELCEGWGETRQQALNAALGLFLFGMMAVLLTMMRQEAVMQLTSETGGTVRRWRLVQSDITGLGQPLDPHHRLDFWNLIRQPLPHLLNSGKTCLITLSAARDELGKTHGECLIDGQPCARLAQQARQCAENWPQDGFAWRRQIFLLEQDPEQRQCAPYSRQEVFRAVQKAVRLFQACQSSDQPQILLPLLSHELHNASLAEELVILLPEVCAQMLDDTLALDDRFLWTHQGKTETLSLFQLTSWKWLRPALEDMLRSGRTERELIENWAALSQCRHHRQDASELQSLSLPFSDRYLPQ